MTATTTKPHHVAEENARKFADWLKTRGGILIWNSADLGSAGRSVSTPALTEDGKPYPSPGWQFPNWDRHVTDIADVEVYTVRVVETFKIRLKRSGMNLVLNNASDRRVRTALDRAGDGSSYRFGATGTSQGNPAHGLMFGEDMVEICVDDTTVPLTEWLTQHP